MLLSTTSQGSENKYHRKIISDNLKSSFINLCYNESHSQFNNEDPLKKVSVDILCTENSNGAWKSIIHLTSDQTGAIVPGNRQFSVYKTPWNGYLELSASDPGPNGYNYRGAYNQQCTIGEWNTYAVEVSQVDGSPSTLKYVMTFDGTSAKEGTYDASLAYRAGPLYAYVSEDITEADSETSVRNFYYQTFSDTACFPKVVFEAQDGVDSSLEDMQSSCATKASSYTAGDTFGATYAGYLSFFRYFKAPDFNKNYNFQESK